MKTTYFKWNNPTTNDLIIKEVQLSPTNLTSAFSRVAAKINTSQQSVAAHWYKNLRKNTKGFSIGSKALKVNNVKNSARKLKPSIVKDLSEPIDEVIVSTKKLDSMRVVTVKKYFID